jgi:hypothetical protein
MQRVPLPTYNVGMAGVCQSVDGSEAYRVCQRQLLRCVWAQKRGDDAYALLLEWLASKSSEKRARLGFESVNGRGRAVLRPSGRLSAL